MPRDYAIAAAAILIPGALCAFAHPAVRRALLDGLHCLSRHPDLWRIPALFGLGYAVFQIAAAALLHWRLQDLPEWILAFTWNPPPPLSPILTAGVQPAAERTASVFTIFTATFPLSAWFALLLLFNSHGLLVEMVNALRRRLGPWRGAAVAGLLLVTVLCAIAKPAVYLFLPEITACVPFHVALLVDWLSGIFELLLGIYLLTYLMLMTYAWRRGLFFRYEKLQHVAMRRAGFVLKWSLLLAALFAVFILLPLEAGLFFAVSEDFQAACTGFAVVIGPCIIVAFALIHCPVQAVLVFHNESLRQALRDGRRIFRSRWAAILPFLIASGSAFLALTSSSAWLTVRLGAETSAALGTHVVFAMLEAMLAGWLIAGWVCLYKNLPEVRKEILF